MRSSQRSQITTTTNDMKKLHSGFLLVLSSLLILTLTVFVMRMDGHSKEIICTAMAAYLFDMSCYDRTLHDEYISAKRSLPGKDTKEEHEKKIWQINIASFSHIAKANELVELSKKRGFDTNKIHISANGKEFWRVSVKVDMSYDKVKNYAFLVKDMLGLEEVWISNQTNL